MLCCEIGGRAQMSKALLLSNVLGFNIQILTIRYYDSLCVCVGGGGGWEIILRV